MRTESSFGQEETPVTTEEGIHIQNVIDEHLPEQREKKIEHFGRAARELVKALPEIFLEGWLSILAQ